MLLLLTIMLLLNLTLRRFYHLYPPVVFWALFWRCTFVFFFFLFFFRTISFGNSFYGSVEGARVASPATSVEEIPTPSSKRPRLSAKDKEKERVGSSVFDDEGVAVERAHNIVKAEDLKVFSGVPVNVVASQHVHKIVQVRLFIHFPLSSFSLFFFFLLTFLSCFVRCWGRAFIWLLSVLLKRLRWLL